LTAKKLEEKEKVETIHIHHITEHEEKLEGNANKEELEATIRSLQEKLQAKEEVEVIHLHHITELQENQKEMPNRNS
jgi:hypothetical protein